MTAKKVQKKIDKLLKMADKYALTDELMATLIFSANNLLKLSEESISKIKEQYKILKGYAVVLTYGNSELQQYAVDEIYTSSLEGSILLQQLNDLAKYLYNIMPRKSFTLISLVIDSAMTQIKIDEELAINQYREILDLIKNNNGLIN